MAENNLVLIIEANQGYIRNINPEIDFSAQNEILFTAITDTYIPLLNMMDRLEQDKINFKLGIVLSAPLCALLADPQIQNQYVAHLDKLIDLGKSEVNRLKNSPELNLAMARLETYEQTKKDFTDKYNKKLLSRFRYFAKHDFIELIPSSATFAYLPHLSNMEEILNAQVETGLYSQKYFFDETGEGFYLPYLGWSKPMAKVLRSYGVNYTIVDARSLLYSRQCPDMGIFSPVRCSNSLVLFGADPETASLIYGEEGYAKNDVYRSQLHDIGFSLDKKDLSSFIAEDSPRIQTGFKYWSNESDDEDNLSLYNPQDAHIQAEKDARDFYEKKAETFRKANEVINDRDLSLVCRIPQEVLGQSWFEGVKFLENLIRIIDQEKKLKLNLCKNLIENQFKLPKVEPYPCSSNGLGYGEDLLSNANSWMARYIQKANSRIIELAERFPAETSLKARLLNIGAKEVLLAQSGAWQEMINDGKLPEYAEEIFKKEILSFSKVFDSLAASTVSTEWLTNLEKEDVIFPWMNYKIFSRKK